MERASPKGGGSGYGVSSEEDGDMLNSSICMGRLVHDPELRRTQKATAVCSFTLAVERNEKPDENGKRQADFIDCVAWGQTAEFISKHFTKGQMAIVAGRLQIRFWEDKDGRRCKSAEVVVDRVYFGGAKLAAGAEDQDKGGGLCMDEEELPF